VAGVVMGGVLIVLGLVQVVARRRLGRWGANWRRQLLAPNVRQYARSAENQERWSVVGGVLMMIAGIVIGVVGLSLR
jgi:uncharacterized membrane protein HdeD (DUF308 family)